MGGPQVGMRMIRLAQVTDQKAGPHIGSPSGRRQSHVGFPAARAAGNLSWGEGIRPHAAQAGVLVTPAPPIISPAHVRRRDCAAGYLFLLPTAARGKPHRLAQVAQRTPRSRCHDSRP